jgi:hypothetical protein
LLAVVPMLALIGYSLFQQRSYYTGTDSVGVRSIVAKLPAEQRLCIPDVLVPGGTGAVQIGAASTGSTPPLTATVTVGNRVVAAGHAARTLPSNEVVHATIPVFPALPAHPQARLGTVCIGTGRGAPLSIGGFAKLATSATTPTIAGRPIGAGVALWFLPPSGRTRSLVQSWPAIMHRLTLFRPGFAGSVFYWLLLLAGLPLLGYFAIRLLAVAGEPGRRLALGLGVIAFASAAVWAITTVPFDSPDESEHFAYTESLVEAGHIPDSAPTVRSPYASDEVFAMDATHHFSVIEVGDTRPPWFSLDQHAYSRRVARQHPSRGNGGGYSVATSVHSPLYYAVLAPGYELGHSGGVFDELFWMRLISALLGAVVVVAAYGTVRELVPSRPELAVAAGLIIALQPMFSFISGAVNNDNGVNAMAALAVYLTVRALRRGLTWRLGLALGATVALLPVVKGTGLALLPAIAIALIAIVLIRRSRSTLIGAGAALASFAAIAGLYSGIAGTFHRSASTTASGANVASGQLTGKLTYLWEVFLPRLPFMAPHWPPSFWPFEFIYLKRGFAGFGWYAVFFPNWVYGVVGVVMAAASVGALVLVIRRHAVLVRRWAELLFLALVIIGVIVGVEFAFYAATPRPIELTPEQGRYAFTAIVPLAVLALAGLLLLPRRWGKAGSAVLVGGMACFVAASHLLYLTANFT